ncbi:hypothetical protein [Hyphobacterium sp.]|uniref:hypothetical protein n=1 Tax=Hyphobacterium sp. TaxID=2004662 RepID=UPI003B51ACAF
MDPDDLGVVDRFQFGLESGDLLFGLGRPVEQPGRRCFAAAQIVARHGHRVAVTGELPLDRGAPLDLAGFQFLHAFVIAGHRILNGGRCQQIVA